MLRKLSTIMVVVLLATMAMYAQHTGQVMRKAPVIMQEPAATLSQPARTGTNPTPKVVAWKAVDTMNNIYGPAIGTINPLAYDPYSNVVAVFHRGGTPSSPGGSGALWYNISTNQGGTWSRVPVAVNTGSQPTTLRGRYPSMNIMNATKGHTIGDAMGVFAWPALDNAGSGFDLCGYGADQPLGAGTPFSAVLDHEGTYSSQTPIWTCGDAIIWTAEYSTAPAAHPYWQGRLFRTIDYSTIDSLVPPFFDKDANFAGLIVLGGASRGNTTYIGFVGAFDNPDTLAPFIKSGWYPAVAKSTDKGATWSAEEVIDFRKIPALSRFDRLHDYIKGDSYVSYGGDINVDGSGYPHLVVVLTDTTVDGNSGNNAVCEIYKTASGWDGKIVYDGISDSSFTKLASVDPGLGQMGPSPYLAFDTTGTKFACQWVNPVSTRDSICDIWVATRTSTGSWSAPTNLTSTPNMNEDASHFAPFLAGSGTSFTAFSFYSYERGNTTYQIIQTNPAEIFCAPVPLTISDVNDNSATVNSFTLDQNYPNPFNPSTSIRFSLTERSNVTLKVYDLIGREVATVLNTVQEAGPHIAMFDASSLASGVYVYTLKAGNATLSKKMTLLK